MKRLKRMDIKYVRPFLQGLVNVRDDYPNTAYYYIKNNSQFIVSYNVSFKEGNEMSEITFLASSVPFRIPDEIEEYNNRTYYEREEDFIYFSVKEIDDDYWEKKLDGLFSMPYIYEAIGVGNKLFLTYIEKYMELGDVFEIYEIPNQHAFDEYRQRMNEQPEAIEVNTLRHTYKTIHGLYQFDSKKWVEELSHRVYLTPYGITTFIKY